MRTTEYRNDSASLPHTVFSRFRTLGIHTNDLIAASKLMEPLALKGPAGIFHYEHSMRVGLLACEIAHELELDEKALFLAGLLHDVGKALVPVCTLCATEKWTAEDQANMRQHVMDGFRLLRDRFDFTAHVIAHHHFFQRNAYPEELPEPLQPLSEETLSLIRTYGEVLAIADVYDAMHRVNSGSGGVELTEDQIKERMLAQGLPHVERLYAAGVLGRRT